MMNPQRIIHPDLFSFVESFSVFRVVVLVLQPLLFTVTALIHIFFLQQAAVFGEKWSDKHTVH